MSADERRSQTDGRTRAAAIGAVIGFFVTLATVLVVAFGGGSPGTGSIVAAIVFAPVAGGGVAGYWYRSRSDGGWLGATVVGTGLGFTVGVLLLAVVLESLARAPLTGGAGPAVLVIVVLLGVSVVLTTVFGAVGGFAGAATCEVLVESADHGSSDAECRESGDSRDAGSTDDR